MFWPNVSSEVKAEEACRNSAKAALLVAVVTAVLSVVGALGVHFHGLELNLLGLVDAAIFGYVAWGLFRYSRVAATIGLVTYAAERLGTLGSGSVAGLPLTIVLFLAFIGGVRGAFAYHRFQEAAAAATSTAATQAASEP